MSDARGGIGSESAAPAPRDRRVYAVIVGCLFVASGALLWLPKPAGWAAAVLAGYWLVWRLALLPFHGRERSRWVWVIPFAAGLLLGTWWAASLAFLHGPVLVALFGLRRDRRSPDALDDTKRARWEGVITLAVVEAVALTIGTGVSKLAGAPTLF